MKPLKSRRNFLKGILAAGAGFAILPGAGRLWTPRPKEELVTIYEYRSFEGEDEGGYSCLIIEPQTKTVLHSHRWELEMDLKIMENFSG